MIRIKMPRLFILFPKVCFLLSTLTCYKLNATLLTLPSLETYFLGCFQAWHNQFTKLRPAVGERAFDPANSISSCAEKCTRENPPAKFIFLRGIECQCVFDDSSFLAIHIEDFYCDSSCSGKKAQPTEESCGGNVAYSVYCVSFVFSSDDCNNIISQIKQKYPVNNTGALESTLKMNSVGYPEPVMDVCCGECKMQEANYFHLCTPHAVSPDFDYFPLNNARKCAEFCHSSVHYVDWDSEGIVHRNRPPKQYAILLWWNVPNVMATVPICLCGDDETKADFPAAPGFCDATECPDNPTDSCGGFAGNSIFGTVYCIEDGSGKCGNSLIPTTSTATTTDTSKSTGHKDTTATYEPTTTEITTPTQAVTTTNFQSTSTFRTTTEATTATDFQTTLMFPITTVTSENPRTTTFPTSITSSTTTDNSVKGKGCRRWDRHGNLWEEEPNKTAYKNFSCLIDGSPEKKAFWICSKERKGRFYFATEQPNVSQCSSRWVQEMENELYKVDNMDKARSLTRSLLDGCTQTNNGIKYYGHEIFNLTFVLDETLNRAWSTMAPRRSYADDFEELVSWSIDVNACLINSAGPWEDLSRRNKSSLSSTLVDSTEDILFYWTKFKFVGHNEGSHKKVFTPMNQFTAVAEVFAKGSKESNDEPRCDVDGKSCVKFPPGWTRELPGDKVQIAIIRIEPESVAKVMTGTGVYEVNGEKNSILNGRLISISVKSSPISRVDSPVSGVRSNSLNFSEKGVEISFPHIVDAYGGRVYKIQRKLHNGEKPMAVMGSTQCVFWKIGGNGSEWSTKGCKLVNTNRLETICECSHLTSFAVLMEVHEYVGKQWALEILTLILCPLSELSLLLTIIILSIKKSHAHKVRTRICTHLSLCLFIGNAMILLVLDRHYLYLSDGFCIGAAMATHYVFLCAFMWMLFEGVQLYRVVIHVFDLGRSYMLQYTIIAYGTPMIIISITAAVGHIKGDKPYGGDTYCWLLGNYIWTFMLPVAVVITVNLIVLFIALKTSVQLQHQRQLKIKLSPNTIMEKILSYRVHFKGCFSLTVLMGLTWIVGFFTLMEGQSKLTAAYLFTILNVSQGFFIFLSTCHTYIRNDRLFTRRKLSNIPSNNESPIINRKPKGKLILASGNGRY